MKKKIHVNRVGYMTGTPKTAVCAVSAGVFYLVDARSGVSVYAGRLSKPSYDKESGDMVRLADFTDFNTEGAYFIRAGYRRSDVFEIAAKPYTMLKGAVLEGLYLNRCGYEYSDDYSDIRGNSDYIHRACHTDKLPVYGADSDIRLDVSGGWHNNGSYNKSVSAACLAVSHMLYALRLFPDSFSRSERAMTENECKWGLQWLLKMQAEDGGVYRKVGTLQGGDFTAPDEDDEEYFIFGKSCRASVRFTAAAAMAAEYFAEDDPMLSRKLRSAAEKSWLWIVQTPEYGVYCGYSDNTAEKPDPAGDDDYMWALCEMYSLTGDECFHEMIAKKYLAMDFSGFESANVGGFAALSYMLTAKKKDRAVESSIRKKMTDRADRMWIADRESGYSTSRSAGRGYSYGSNAAFLSDGMCFAVAYLLSGNQKYLMGATDQFSYIFGRNPMSISYMTGVGDYCVCHPYHRLSATDDIELPVKGMVVSGANVERNDGYSIWHIEKGTPPGKCYVDNEYSFSTNEPAIHFGTPVVFMSAFYEKVGRSTLTRRSINKDPDIVSD